MQCFVFHLYKGVRAGGGIGDEIDPPDGDDYEAYRIMFDITFFFFVIVILLAIIQGELPNNIHLTTCTCCKAVNLKNTGSTLVTKSFFEKTPNIKLFLCKNPFGSL